VLARTARGPARSDGDVQRGGEETLLGGERGACRLVVGLQADRPVVLHGILLDWGAPWRIEIE
jgi:hypothetical protein